MDSKNKVPFPGTIAAVSSLAAILTVPVFPGNRLRTLQSDLPSGPAPAMLPDRCLGRIERCLRRDPQLRLRDIGEAWIELNDAINDPERVKTNEAHFRSKAAVADTQRPISTYSRWIPSIQTPRV